MQNGQRIITEPVGSSTAEVTVRSGSERCDFTPQNVGVQNGVRARLWHVNRFNSIPMAAWGATKAKQTSWNDPLIAPFRNLSHGSGPH